MSEFVSSKLEKTTINSGIKLANGRNSLSAEVINAIIEGILYNSENLGQGVELDDYYTKAEIDALLNYKEIKITNFTAYPSIIEKNQEVDVTYSWDLSKNPKKQVFSGGTVANSERSQIVIENGSISRKLVVTGEKGETDTKTAYVYSYYAIFYGVNSKSTISSTDLTSLSKAIQGAKSKTFTVNASGEEYIYYCIPSSYGIPIFTVGGFEGDFSKVNEFTYNGTTYYAYRSDNKNLGNTTVVVS
jgi:hypothetical protein